MKRNICDMCKNCKDNDKSMAYCFDVCGAPIDIIRQIEAHRNVSLKRKLEWIPVTKKLPETDDVMLVTCKTKTGLLNVNRAYYSNGFWHGSGSMSGVIAWMPLPEPYKEAKNENKSI